MDNTRDKLIEMKRQLAPKDIKENELKAKFTKKPADVKKFKGRQARLKGMMTQWEPFQTMIDNYVAKKVKESRDLPDKIARLKKIVKDECAHPVDSLEVIEDFVGHSEYSKAQTTWYVKCKLCGKKKMMETKVHTSYE